MPKIMDSANTRSVLDQIGVTLSSSLDLKEIMLKTCHSAVTTFGVDHSGLVLFDIETMEGTVEAEFPDWGLIGKKVQVKGIPDEEELIRSKKPLVVSDIAKRLTLGPTSALLANHGIKSALFIPVTYNKQILGSFSLESTADARNFTQREIRLCQLFAEKVASAIESARLFSLLTRTTQNFNELVSSSLHAVVFIDDNKRVTVFNQQAEALFGYKFLEIRGKSLEGLYNDVNEGRKIWNDIHHEGKVLRRQVTLLHKNGTKIPVLLSASSIKDNYGNEVGQAGFMHTRLIEDRLYALIQATQAVSGTLKLEDVLQRIIESLISALPVAEKGVIHLYDEETGRLIVRANKGYSPEVARAASFRNGEGRAGWVYKHNTPLIIDNIQKDKRFEMININIDHPEIYEQKSTICVPLHVKGSVIGTISLDNLTVYNAFSRNDIELLSIFANQVAIAIENAQLFEQVQDDLHIAKSFYEISSQLYPTHAPNEALKFIAAHVKEKTGALSVSITALDTAGRPYEKAHDGYQEKQRIVRPRGLSTIVMETGKPLIIPDVSKTTVTINPGMIKSGVKAAICLPLQAQGKNMGVMWITYAHPHSFSETEVKLFGLLANHAGSFIESAHLFQERQVLLETSKMILSASNLDECLQTLATLMIKSLSATTFCVISMLDDSLKMLTVRAAYSVIEDLHWDPEIGRQYALEDSVNDALTIETGETQILQRDKSPEQIANLKRITRFYGELKSAVLIPLTIGKRVFGVITLGERREWERGSFTLERVGLYQAMAGQVAAFIARMKLQEQAERDATNFHRLYEASSRIGSTHDPVETLHFVVEKACEAVDGWRAAAILLDEAKRPHRLAAVGFNKMPDVTSIRKNGVSMKVVNSGTPVLIEDTKLVKDEINPGMWKDGVKAAICLPLRLREENIGVLWIHFLQPRHFLPAQIEALELYAVQAAIAYDNSRRLHELSQLRSAFDAIASVAEPKEVLQQIAQSARVLLEADYSVIWSYDQIRDVFIPDELVTENIPEDVLRELRENEPDTGKTTRKVLEEKYIEVHDLSRHIPEFIGAQTKKLLKRLKVRSFQAIRLEVSDDLLGVLYLDYKTHRGFGMEEQRLLEYLANNAALALKRARLLDQLHTAQNAATVVAQIIALGNAAQETWDSIVRGAKDALHCDAVTLYRYNEDTDELGFPPAMIGVRNPQKVLVLPKIPAASIVWQTILSTEPIIVDDALSDPFTANRPFTLEEGIKSLVAIPLRVGDHSVGAMFVNYHNKHRFGNNELRNISLFASQAAIAIRNAKLHADIQRRVDALQTLHDAARTITSTLTLDETLERITAQALRIVGENPDSGRCFSHIALLEGMKLPFVAACPHSMLSSLQIKAKIEIHSNEKIGITGRAAKTNRLQYIADVHNSEEPDFIDVDDRIHSQLSVPLCIGDQVIGVLSIEHVNLNSFTEADIKNVELLSMQAAIAIQNSKQFEELKNTKKSLNAQTAIAWIGMASSTWGHGVEKTAITIREQVQLFRQNIANQSHPDILITRLNKIEQLANKILEKPITPPLSEEQGVSSVPINEFILDRVESLQEHPEYQEVSFDFELNIDDTATTRASLEWLRRALGIVLENAEEATRGLDRRHIRIVNREQDGKALLEIIDNGIGIPDHILNSMLNEPIAKKKGEKGWGMGLLFAQMIFHTYGGEIRCKKTSSEGTSMLIILPLERGPAIHPEGVL